MTKVAEEEIEIPVNERGEELNPRMFDFHGWKRETAADPKSLAWEFGTFWNQQILDRADSEKMSLFTGSSTGDGRFSGVLCTVLHGYQYAYIRVGRFDHDMMLDSTPSNVSIIWIGGYEIVRIRGEFGNGKLHGRGVKITRQSIGNDRRVPPIVQSGYWNHGIPSGTTTIHKTLERSGRRVTITGEAIQHGDDYKMPCARVLFHDDGTLHVGAGEQCYRASRDAISFVGEHIYVGYWSDYDTLGDGRLHLCDSLGTVVLLSYAKLSAHNTLWESSETTRFTGEPPFRVDPDDTSALAELQRLEVARFFGKKRVRANLRSLAHTPIERMSDVNVVTV